jgi:hypothetical protein
MKRWKEKGALFLSMGNPYIYFKQASRNYLTEMNKDV